MLLKALNMAQVAFLVAVGLISKLGGEEVAVRFVKVTQPGGLEGTKERDAMFLCAQACARSHTCVSFYIQPCVLCQNGILAGVYYSQDTAVQGYKCQHGTADASCTTCLCDTQYTGFYCQYRRCPENMTYYVETGNCLYNAISPGVVYSTAKTDCATMNATVLVITSAQKQLFIERLVQGEMVDIWIGLEKDPSTNQWFWLGLSSQPLVYNNWYPTEPDNTPAWSNCVRLRNLNNWQWGDHPCSMTYSYICERSPIHV